MLAAHDTERRTVQRRPTLKGGQIAFNRGQSTIDCKVRNLSTHGARLDVTSVFGIPDRFELLLTETRARQTCRVAWRTPKQLGVVFERG